MEHEARELVARRVGKRRRRVEHPADFWRVDAEQTNAAELRDVDRVAIDHGADQHELRPFTGRRCECCSNCNSYADEPEQKLHRDCSTQRVTGIATRDCKLSASLLNSDGDDGIVVVMTTKQYLATPETNRPRELAYGIVRDPPAPFFSHQQVVVKIVRLLADYVEANDLGVVGVAPLDVVLDAERALIVQPDVLFVSQARLSIIDKQVWGGPDLVVEVLSPGTAMHDRTKKLGWYRQYGVRECWFVEMIGDRLNVIDFTGATPETRAFTRSETLQSSVLPDFHPPASLLLP